MIARWCFVMAVIFQLGCAHTYVMRDNGVAVEHRDFRLHSIVWSFVPIKKLPPVDEICPGGRYETLDLRLEPVDALITLATLGFYVPHRVTVGCSKIEAQ